MDFDDTAEEAAFRTRVRTWLEEHAPAVEGDHRAHDPFRDPTTEGEAAHIEACQQWQRLLFEHGWAGLTWPTEYGGGGLSSHHQGIFNREQARFDVSTGVFAVGIGMVGPTLIAHGTHDQKERYLTPMLRGDEIWCQLFSEPEAGSDLASLRTRAARAEGGWVVSGQKVWTSGAHFSDFGILLARTDPDVPKHAGITYFIVDMSSPGIDVRPLRQIDGSAHFNEVFLDDVAIPEGNVVGDVNGGWRVAQTTLLSERTLIGGGQRLGFDQVLALAQRTGGAEDPCLRQELARCFTRYELLRYLGYRVQTAVSHGEPPGPEASVMKLALSHHLEATGDLVMALEGPAGTLLDGDAPGDGFWQYQFLGQWRSRIGGGTDQIQRNIVGERVLGLPREPRTDKDVPFREVPGVDRD